MKRLYTFSALLVVLSCTLPILQGSEHTYTLGLSTGAQPFFKFSYKDKFGFIDKNGQTVIAPAFQSVGDFFEDRASFSEAGRFGFIDTKGVKVIAPSFDEVRPFSDGLAAVRIGRVWGYIDAGGLIVITPRFQAVGPMSGGMARVATWDRFTCAGTPSELSLSEAPDQFFGLPDELGDRTSCQPSSARFGFIDRSGKIAIPQQYSYAFDFVDGLARVKMNDHFAFINRIGKVVLSVDGTDASDFSEGLAAIKLENGWAYVNSSGRPAFSERFEYAHTFSQGLAAAATISDGKCGYIDSSGTYRIRPRYDFCESFSDGLALVTINNDTDTPVRYFIDSNGHRAFTLPIESISAFTGGLSLIETDGKKVYVNHLGRVVRSFE